MIENFQISRACCPSNYRLPEHCFPRCSAARGIPTNDSDFTQSANSCFALRQRRLPFGAFFLVEWVPIRARSRDSRKVLSAVVIKEESIWAAGRYGLIPQQFSRSRESTTSPKNVLMFCKDPAFASALLPSVKSAGTTT